METSLEKAKRIAEIYHKGQVDKAGKPYMNHLRAVSDGVRDLGETYAIIGLLHDTLEDTDMTIEKLRTLFGDTIADAVSLLTHDDKVPYLDYIRNLKKSGNPYAIEVKKSDLRNNMDLSRLPAITEKDLKRLEKYQKAYEILCEK